ncbi:phospholipase effector Tle1 domain-containing protein [Flavobacterium sp.]|uniref:phospholipase effector Tle1 domain-containing protein n=1 Tax=Flavobacterium sp. TaxID=239 RepID=UPI00374DC899
MKFYIKGDSRPIIGKNVYSLMYTKTTKDQEKKGVQLYVNEKDNHKEVDGAKIVKQQWTLLKNGKLFLDLGNDGGVTFSQASLGINYTIVVTFTDIHGTKDTAKLNITPVAGTPSIENLKWQDQYYRDLDSKAIAYSDNVHLFIHTLNIPAGDRLQVTIWEDEGTDGHANSSRNMGTYTTSPVDKYGKAELYFNNIKAYQKILNDKDFKDESEHEFYAQVKYIGKIDTIQDTIQLKIINDLKKTVEPPKNNSLAKVAAPDKQKKPDDKTGVKVTVNVFFDGTLNNMKNTEARLAFEKKKKGFGLSPDETLAAKVFEDNDADESSYDNYFSNIAIMHNINTAKNSENKVKIYIEGEGTRDNDKDDVMGFAFGSGDKSGIPVKVNKAFIEIKKKIDKLKADKFIKENQFVNEIDLTVFGFSRGAAAARNFISQRRKLQDIYNLESNKFTIQFVGLFDTVSSYEVEGNYGRYGSAASHDFDDVEELKLKLEGNIKKVIHLTAADEYRENFSLTNIKSSINAGIGYELSLPGVHSDIGGGYAEIENEKRKLHLENGYPNIKETLIKEGWYQREQIVTTTTKQDEYSYTKHIGTRKISLSYQFIPLAIMVKLAENYKMIFDNSLMQKGKKETYKVPDDLEEAKNSLLDYAITNDGAHSKAVTLENEKLHSIRNKYLHRSTCDSMGKEGRYKDGKPYRKIING